MYMFLLKFTAFNQYLANSYLYLLFNIMLQYIISSSEQSKRILVGALEHLHIDKGASMPKTLGMAVLKQLILERHRGHCDGKERHHAAPIQPQGPQTVKYTQISSKIALCSFIFLCFVCLSPIYI